MQISKEQFFHAASKIGLSEQDKTALWNSLEATEAQGSSVSKLFYYLGAMIVISAMTWFMNLSWEAFGGGGILFISLLYAILFVLAGKKLWDKEELKIPAGLLITLAVCMVPLSIYGLETYLSLLPQDSTDTYPAFFSWVKSSWIWMEIGTITAGLVALKYFPFPFLTAPIYFAAWFLSMDIVPLLFGNEASFKEHAWMSLIFGVLFLLTAYALDLKKMSRFSFWGYLFGTLTFWGSLTILCFSEGEAVLFLYLLINLSMMVKSIFLKRKVLLVFGSWGVFLYFSHLAYDLFENSILFPFVLTFLGLLVIYLGVLYQRNSHRIEKMFLSSTPTWLRKLLPYDRP